MKSSDALIDYKNLLANYNEEEHNQKAEDYFATIADTSYLITKPFYTTVGAPSLLGNFAALIEASKLFMRCEVLDFATGSGWTARLVAQMGCNVTGVDISKSAISIADSATKTFPLVGNAGTLKFGITTILTESKFENYFDRIIIMDAYHHLPNPQETLKLFFNILKPGGILAMSEPGRYHSKTAPAQAEMRQYGILERDFIVEEIENDAKVAGFVDIECGYFSPIPVFVEVRDFTNIFSAHQNNVSKSIETNQRSFKERKCYPSLSNFVYSTKELHDVIMNSKFSNYLHTHGSHDMSKPFDCRVLLYGLKYFDTHYLDKKTTNPILLSELVEIQNTFRSQKKEKIDNFIKKWTVKDRDIKINL